MLFMIEIYYNIYYTYDDATNLLTQQSFPGFSVKLKAKNQSYGCLIEIIEKL